MLHFVCSKFWHAAHVYDDVGLRRQTFMSYFLNEFFYFYTVFLYTFKYRSVVLVFTYIHTFVCVFFFLVDMQIHILAAQSTDILYSVCTGKKRSSFN